VQQGEEIIQVQVQKLNLLLVEAMGVMRQTPALSPKAWEEALLCPDGQIHDAASNVRCISVSESCFQPCTPESPRHCPAKDKERRGCDCDGLACAQFCCQATPRDPEARFIWYTGSNQSPDSPNHSTRADAAEHESGEARYGDACMRTKLAFAPG
jgi:hypothetical protein